MGKPHIISHKRIREAWAASHTKTKRAVAAELGVDPRTLRNWARDMGLGCLPDGPRPSYDAELLRAAWLAGVSGYQIAALFGLDQSTISHAATNRLGLAKRKAGTKPKMTMAQFLEARLAARMTETAKIERAALWDAEMIDGHRNRDRMAA